MKAFNGFSLVLIASLIVNAGNAYGAAPPNVVTSDGCDNTAMGAGALFSLTDGCSNTASGRAALSNNTTGSSNTATGSLALAINTTGSRNTATGDHALVVNKTGIDNTASGDHALFSNTTGLWNTASGSRALQNNTTAKDNTADGFAALDGNTTGEANTATGSRAMFFNTTGNLNTATGYSALYSNTSGIDNAALGYQALYQNSTGFRNAALGYQAGYAVTGSDNITIGGGNQGKATENGVIRIGVKANQKKTFVAGISGVQTGLAAAKTVFIDANGQLGTLKSSREFKEDIHPMGETSDRLLALRPVTFRYKQAYDDGSKPITYGLIAEEVAESFPELVVNDAEGNPETVRYDLVSTLLLNEFQKEHGIVEAQSAELAQLKKQVAVMAEVIERLERDRMVAAAH